MLAHTLILIGLSLGGALADGVGRLQDAMAADDEPRPAAAEATFEAAERAVSNWPSEAAARLEPGPLAALAALVEADRPVVTRCVKLNNYWCIKSARWNGELGTDEEGHVGFASAERGADAAATLLRRYYLEFGRKSALDIVRRWAPAECTLTAATGIAATGASPAVSAGIAGTVRARYLAARRKVRPAATARRAAAPRLPTPRISSPPPGNVPAFRVPDIAVGVGEKPLTLSSTLPYRMTPPRRGAPSAPVASPLPAATPMPAAPSSVACAPDEQRLRNYAGRIADSLNLGSGDDLKLFDADGMPTANLAPVMLAMSAFELGTLRAGADLVEEAVERQRERARAERPPETP